MSLVTFTSIFPQIPLVDLPKDPVDHPRVVREVATTSGTKQKSIK
jgi:hypothetical protein